VTGIEMQNNPSHADNHTSGAAEAATKIEIRGSPLGSATTGVGAPSADTDHVEGEQVEEGVETAQLRAEIEKLKQDHADHERTLVAEIAQLRGENEHLKQAQPGAVVSLGVAG